MVHTRLDAIRREWNRSEGESVLLGIVPSAGSDSDDLTVLRTVTELVASVNVEAKARWDSIDRGYGHEPVATPRGPVVSLTCYDRRLMEGWVALLAQRLDDVGIDCTIGPIRSELPEMRLARIRPTEDGPLTCFTAVLSLRGWTLRPGRDRPQSRGAWATDPAIAAELVDWAVDWTHLSNGATYLKTPVTSMRVEPASAASLLTASLGSARAMADVGTYRGVNEARRVNFEFAGRLILEIRSTSRTWQDIVAELGEQVRARADVIDYALIRQGWVFAGDFEGVVNRMPPKQPHRPNSTAVAAQFRERQHLDTAYVPDANPIQLLTNSHLARATDLSSWRIEEVAPGRHLVSTREPEAWFANPEIAPGLVSRARADFGDLILLDRMI